MIELKESEKYRINEIMNEFDFDKVHKCMVGMGWTWFSAKGIDGIPSVSEIKLTAHRLLSDLATEYLRNGKTGYIGTGGLQVAYIHKDDFIELKFVVTEWNDIHATEEIPYKNILKKEKRLGKINKLLNNGQ
jgi:hypothetical protein